MTGEKSVVDKPLSLMLAVGLLYLECAGLAGLTIWLVVLDLTADKESVGVAVALTVLAALAAVSVFFLARTLWGLRRGGRGPAIVVQLFVIASGGFLVQVHPLWLGVVLITLGVVVSVLIVVPTSTKALGVD